MLSCCADDDINVICSLYVVTPEDNKLDNVKSGIARMSVPVKLFMRAQ
jgi:hypothetical protein